MPYAATRMWCVSHVRCGRREAAAGGLGPPPGPLAGLGRLAVLAVRFLVSCDVADGPTGGWQ